MLRLRIPELNEERRKELVKVAHKYAEAPRSRSATSAAMGSISSRSSRRITRSSEDDQERLAGEVQKATDRDIAEIDQMLAAKEKEILTV